MLQYFFAYRYAVGTGVLTTLALFFMQAYETWLGVVLAAVIWGSAIAFLSYRLRKKIASYSSHVLLLAMTALAFAGLTSLIEIDALRIGLNITGGCAIFLVHASALRGAYGLRDRAKQWRRVQMMLWAFAVYGLGTVLFALVIFFPRITWVAPKIGVSALIGLFVAFLLYKKQVFKRWHYPIGIGLVSGVITWYLLALPVLFFSACMGIVSMVSAYSLWQLYHKEETAKLSLWAALLGAMSTQLFLVATFALPYGYLALGFLHVWLWYIAQLLIRFHLSTRGIVWKKQQVFLIGNALVFLFVLFRFIRWI